MYNVRTIISNQDNYKELQILVYAVLVFLDFFFCCIYDEQVRKILCLTFNPWGSHNLMWHEASHDCVGSHSAGNFYASGEFHSQQSENIKEK